VTRRPTLTTDLLVGLLAGVGTALAAVLLWPGATRSPWMWVLVPLAAWVIGNRIAALLVYAAGGVGEVVYTLVRRDRPHAGSG
jgi:hypothetical protein